MMSGIDWKNGCNTWQQGHFIDGHQYKSWSVEDKAKAEYHELHLVRPSPKGNAICKTNYIEDATWIAGRLNLCMKLLTENAELKKKVEKFYNVLKGSAEEDKKRADESIEWAEAHKEKQP